MKTYTTTEIQEFDYSINYASALSAGYGHKEITVIVEARTSGENITKGFKSVTSNMHDFDSAEELEGQEKYEALFELVENNLDGKIAEWLYSELY